jgi:long-chain acyl-CoA synthetase
MPSRPWFKTYRELGVNPDVDVESHQSVTDLLDEAMRVYAERTAFRAAGQRLTYSEIDRLSAAFAAWLQTRLGVRKGDRVAVMTPNVPAFPIAFLGIIRAGAIQVNVNPFYTPRELEHQLKDSGSTIILVFDGVAGALAEIVDNTPIKTVIVAGATDGASRETIAAKGDGKLLGAFSFAEALREGEKMQRQPVELEGGDPLFLQYTGGTTGLSKGACLSHRNLVANVMQFKAFMPEAMRPGEEVIVTALPLYHIFALMVNFITYFSIGAENWLVANPRDLDGLVDVLDEAKPSVFMGVNTLYAGLAAHPRLDSVDFSRLRLAGGGGAAVMPATSARWEAATGTFIREGYGLSETGPILSFNPAAVDAFTATTGLPLPGTDIKVLNEDGAEVAPGEAGEICARGPQVMSGYWHQPEANAAAFTEDGYFRTGDMGTLNDKGFLKIVDRKKDMIIVSGFIVYPNEIEAVAAACPGVLESACIGVPDERTGEAVHLFVIKATGATLTVEDVHAYCRANLTAYKAPRLVSIVDALPKTSVGKILRRALRQNA